MAPGPWRMANKMSAERATRRKLHTGILILQHFRLIRVKVRTASIYVSSTSRNYIVTRFRFSTSVIVLGEKVYGLLETVLKKEE